MPRTTNKLGLGETSVRLDPYYKIQGWGQWGATYSQHRGSSHTYSIREYNLPFFFHSLINHSPQNEPDSQTSFLGMLNNAVHPLFFLE